MGEHGIDKQTKRFAGQLTAHRARVFAWVMHRVGADRTVAEDVTQDCFVRVWETRQHNPPPPGALHTYLLITAQNLLRDRFRRGAMLPETDAAYAESADAATVEGQFLLRETLERLAAEAALMPFLLRETLRLRVEENLDYPAIAARMDCPTGTVKSRLSAARSRLRAALDAQETLAPSGTAPSVRVTKQFTVSPHRRKIITTYKEQTTMAASTEINELRAQVQAMEARLGALERGTRAPSEPGIIPWEPAQRQFVRELTRARKEKGSGFALGLHYVVAQSSDQGHEGSASIGNTFERVSELPDDKQLAGRMERMRLLASDITIPRVFRHFYALRFGGREMRATAQELAEATGASEEVITRSLKPFIADRTLLLVSSDDGTAGTYEWEGNDVAITTLLFTGK